MTQFVSRVHYDENNRAFIYIPKEQIESNVGSGPKYEEIKDVLVQGSYFTLGEIEE